MFNPIIYYAVVGAMMVLSVVVFFALQRITAGYGMMYNKKWGPSVSNRIGWIMMETPAFVGMLLMWLLSEHRGNPALIVMASLFELHYFQRSFIFPLAMRGKSRMPLAIIASGALFNIINVYMIGGWLFHVGSAYYSSSWLMSPLFILGTVIFFAGMGINLHSDNIIRHLRMPGDTRHYIPRGGMYNYVTSANYFGETLEWLGYAVLSWNIGSLAFLMWTFANLAPRAKKLHSRYVSEFGNEYKSLNRKYIIPFIY
ncbi:MAG: DUF1295 domain-containing protein [Candidatus Amulumruptor caecigallinarius]|nr:DUF1295 domain-containing protein [Candidatus Amulumruptor caecigallinarius]